MGLLSANELSRCGIQKDSHILTAFSGGADSTALLLALKECLDNRQIGRLSAAHFNHKLRGKDSDEDERFCADLCRRLGIPFHTGSGDVCALASEQKKGTEDAARSLRYSFLEQIRGEIGADCIATAHHADDQAETVLQHLMRGSGIRGICGMDFRSGAIARPFLDFSHADLLDYLARKEQDFRIDGSNRDNTFLRNRIRNDILPELERIRPGIRKHLCNTAGDARSDERFFAPLVRRAMEEADLGDGFSRRIMAGLDPAIRRRVLREILDRELGYDVCRADIEKTERLLNGVSGMQAKLHHGISAWNDGNRIRFGTRTEPKEYEIPIVTDGTVLVPGASVTAEHVKKFKIPESPLEGYVCTERLSGKPLTARMKRSGDRFQPLGMKGSKLLSDIFTDRKYPEKWRNLPLICDGDEIIFVPGYTVSEHVRVDEKSKNIVHLIIKEAENY